MNENDKQWFDELLMLLDDARYLAGGVASSTGFIDFWASQANDLQDLIEQIQAKVQEKKASLKK